MVFAISLSFDSMGSLSTKVILLEFDPLSLKYGVTDFQKVWLSNTFLTLRFSKYCFFVFLKSFTQ